MSAPFSVVLATTLRGRSIHASGELREYGGRVLRGLADQFVRIGAGHVHLDLGDVRAADLDGLRALDYVRETLRRSGAELTIANHVHAGYTTDWRAVRHSTSGDDRGSASKYRAGQRSRTASAARRDLHRRDDAKLLQ